MAGAEKCRANARQCLELAAGVKFPKIKKTFLELAAKWTALATKLEASNGRGPARGKK